MRFPFLSSSVLVGLFLLTTTLTAQRPSPAHPYSTAVSNSQATLQWDNDTAASAWIVTYWIQQSREKTIVNAFSDSIVINTLLPQSTYLWQVCSINHRNDTSALTPIQWFQTLPEHETPFRCAAPTGLEVINAADGNATLQWIPAHASDTLWEFVYGLVSEQVHAQGSLSLINHITYETLHNLQVDEYYQVSVRSVCPDTVSAWITVVFNQMQMPPRTLPILCDFESNGDMKHFAFVNGVDNPWTIDTAENYTFAGKKGLYVSTDGGQQARSANQRTSFSYAYTDIDIPPYARSFYLDFRWKGGEIGDTMQVFLLPRNAALNINNAPEDVYRIGRSFYGNHAGAWQNERIEMDSTFVGLDKKLVFMWKNNLGSSIAQNAIAIDELYVTARYCDRPAQISFSQITAESAVCTWDNIPDQQSFNIQYRKDGDTVWTTKSQVFSGCILDSLQDGVTYHVRLQTRCTTTEESLWSDVSSFTTTARCLPPQQVQISDIYSTQMCVSWQDAVSIRWVVYYRPAGTLQPFSADTLSVQTDTLRRLQPATAYEIFVRGICTTMDLSYPTAISIATTACNPITTLPWVEFQDTLKFAHQTPPPVFPNCWVSNNNEYLSPIFDLSQAGDMELTYTASLEDTATNSVSEVVIAVSNNNGATWTFVDRIQSRQTTQQRCINLSNYAGSQAFRIKIIESLSAMGTPRFFLHRMALTALCNPPSNIIATHVSDTHAVIDWTAANNQSAWTLYYKKDTDSDFIVLPVANRPFTIQHLSANTLYQYQLRSTCGSQTSDTSSILTFRTRPSTQPACLTPTNLRAEIVYAADGSKSIIWTWTLLPGQHRWEVEYKDSAEMFSHNEEVAYTSRYTLRNVALYRTYGLRVRAICDTAGRSEWTESVSMLVTPNSIDEIAEQTICHIYPNPTSGEVNIDLPTANLYAVEVYSTAGQLLMRTTTEKTINLSQLPAGVYPLHIHTSMGTLFRKILLYH